MAEDDLVTAPGRVAVSVDATGAVLLEADAEGARRLASVLLELARAGGGDAHWMSPAWGGEELEDSASVGEAVHHLKVVVGGPQGVARSSAPIRAGRLKPVGA